MCVDGCGSHVQLVLETDLRVIAISVTEPVWEDMHDLDVKSDEVSRGLQLASLDS